MSLLSIPVMHNLSFLHLCHILPGPNFIILSVDKSCMVFRVTVFNDTWAITFYISQTAGDGGSFYPIGMVVLFFLYDMWLRLWEYLLSMY